MNYLEVPELSVNRTPPVGYHFAVVFFVGGVIPNPLDMRFQKVSGLSSEIDTVSYREGGRISMFTGFPTG